MKGGGGEVGLARARSETPSGQRRAWGPLVDEGLGAARWILTGPRALMASPPPPEVIEGQSSSVLCG